MAIVKHSPSSHLINRPGSLQAPNLDYILLDGSGSMMDKWHETLSGLQGYVDVLCSMNIRSHGVLNVFSNRLDDIQLDTEFEWWPNLASHNPQPHYGSTALYDAINVMARDLGERNPSRAAITIVTDGDENASRFTSATQARAILDWCRAQGWQVTFLGAEYNNSKMARELGADASNAIGVQKKHLLEASKNYAKKRARYAQDGTDINFTRDEQVQFGGYLAGPSHRE